MISPTNREKFEGVGLEPIKRELAVGNVFFLHGSEQREQAREWVAEKEAKEQAQITALTTPAFASKLT